MALTNFFYWMLAYGSVAEKIAAVGASEDVVIEICARVGPALMRNYGMSAEQVAFITVHEEIGHRVTPIDTLLLARYDTPEDRQRITRAVRLSHEFELLFYDTVMAATPSEKGWRRGWIIHTQASSSQEGACRTSTTPFTSPDMSGTHM